MERVFAQTLNMPGGQSIDGPVSIGVRFRNIGDVVTTALPFVFAFAGFGLLLMILASGFGMLTSAGDAKKMESAQKRLTNAIIGVMLIIGAYWITQLVSTMFGLKIGFN